MDTRWVALLCVPAACGAAEERPAQTEAVAEPEREPAAAEVRPQATAPVVAGAEGPASPVPPSCGGIAPVGVELTDFGAAAVGGQFWVEVEQNASTGEWLPWRTLRMPLHHASRLEWVNLGDHAGVSAAGSGRWRFAFVIEGREIDHDAARSTWFATYRARISAVCRVPAGCAQVRVGLDRRALPRGTSTGGAEMFGRGEASDFAGLAPGGAAPQLFMAPGVASFTAVFEGSSPADAIARCEQTVAAYLPTAPRLPVSMTSAASVTDPCAPCP